MSDLGTGFAMILDARKGDTGYQCYDAKTCRMVKQAVWVNDETAQWGRYVFPPIGGELMTESVQEDRITIYASQRLVVFNEVEDTEPAAYPTTAADHT